MKTQMMIMIIVATIFLAAIAILIGLILWLGWLGGSVVALGALAVLVTLYFQVIKPWHLRWGATDEEVTMAMPGDELIPDAVGATHAIAIDATGQEVWPWLVQIGYGRAGWYSYDWIDNDFKPSADRIIPEYQDLAVGDKILMMPTMGFVVESIEPAKSIVSLLEDGSTSWSLGLYPDGAGGTRLVSRWRPKFEMTPATVAMQVLAEPGTFIMEQKMLRTIRDRVENAGRV
jgi:hypothetical protein